MEEDWSVVNNQSWNKNFWATVDNFWKQEAAAALEEVS